MKKTIQPNQRSVIDFLQSVIDDTNIEGVGGNIQYGSFYGTMFRPAGIAKYKNGNVHYWRGPLDLNGSDFDQSGGGFHPNFPLLNFII